MLMEIAAIDQWANRSVRRHSHDKARAALRYARGTAGIGRVTCPLFAQVTLHRFFT